MQNNKIQRMNELYESLAHHAHMYYDLDNPEITDFEYDALVRELAELEREFPDLTRDNSPTKRVGGAVSLKFAKVNHAVPMLSLDNVFNFDELEAFFAKNNNNLNYDYENADYTCEMKIDGAAVSLIYENGVFTRGATRGNGKTGEDITENLRVIKSIPEKINLNGVIEVRGEVLMKWDNFNALNKKREENAESLFANPRNAAAGTLRQLDPKIVAERGLDVFLYYLVNTENLGITRQSEVLNWLIENNFPVQPVWQKCTGLQAVKDFISEWQEKRFNLNYVTDGVVIKLDDLNLWEKLGATSHAPRWAVAYKYPPEEARTKILSIDIQVGRTGALTPVAKLEPVRLAGTLVQRASLHNEGEIKRKDIRIGDTVRVRKAAEIIPEIISVETELRTGGEKIFDMPEECPMCGAKIAKIPGEAVLRCPNRASCPAQLRESIVYFASRSGMNIMGLGRKLAAQLVDTGKVKNLADIYDLKLEDWTAIERMGKKSALKIMAELEKSKSMPLSNLISALGIRFVGKRAAEILADKFKNLDELKKAVTHRSSENINNIINIEDIDGIGPVTASSLEAFFNDNANLELLKNLAAHGLNFNEVSAPSTLRLSYPDSETKPPLSGEVAAQAVGEVSALSGEGRAQFTGKIFVFTGELESMKRDDAAAIVKNLGGRVTNSVSAKTSFLVAGDKSGSKLKKAEDLNIKILSEEDFLSMINYKNEAE